MSRFWMLYQSINKYIEIYWTKVDENTSILCMKEKKQNKYDTYIT